MTVLLEKGRQLSLQVKQVSHGSPASFVRLLHSLAFVGIHAPLGCGFSGFRFATGGAAVGEGGLIGPPFELF